MKKTLSALLVLAMMLTSVFVMIPAFATDAEVKVINNAEDFAAMEYNGNYRLAADIEIEAGWQHPDNKFEGTFDGDGKKITLLDPAQSAFHEINGGTVKNLVIEGDIAVAKGDVAGLAKYANGTFENITSAVSISIVNNAEGTNDNYNGKAGCIIAVINGPTTVTNCKATGDITVDTTGKMAEHYIGGIAGCIQNGSGTIVFNSCESSATLYSDQTNAYLGGMIGMIQNSRFEANKCLNTGSISVTQTMAPRTDDDNREKNSSYTGLGGMIGGTHQGGGNNGLYVLLSACENTADIIANESEGFEPGCLYVGGMLGRALHNSRFRTSNCKNSGDITVPFNDTGWSGAGGMAGCFMTIEMTWAGKGEAGFTIMEGCTNTGDITGKYAGGLWGSVYQMYHQEQEVRLQYCINEGDVTAKLDAGGMVGLLGESESTVSKYQFIGLKNTGNVTGTRAGGIIGHWAKVGPKYTALVNECINTGTVTTTGVDTTPGAAVAAGIIGSMPKVAHEWKDQTYGNNAIQQAADLPKITVSNCVSTGALVKEDEEGTVIDQDRVAITLDTNLLTEESTGNIYLTGIANGETSVKFGEAKIRAQCDEKIEGIKVTVVDVTKLDGMVTDAKAARIESDYDATAWTEYETALNSAETFLSDYITKTEKEVADEVASLKTALDKLEISLADSTAQKAALEAKIAEAEDKDGSLYTGLSWGRVEDAVKAAKEVLATGDRISVFEAATAAIQKELDALVAKPPKETEPKETAPEETGNASGTSTEAPGNNGGGDKDTEPADKKGCGSAIAATAVVLSTVLTIGACVAFKKKED